MVTVTYPDHSIEAIDEELRQIHTFIRTQPKTSENKRALMKRVDLLLDRRTRLAKRAATMIEG